MTATVVLILAAIAWLIAAGSIVRRLRHALREHSISEPQAIERASWVFWCLITSLAFMVVALLAPR